MKIRRLFLVMMIGLLSFTLMGCPSVQNSGPEFKLVVDGELTKVNHIYYDYYRGTEFHPDLMVQELVSDYGLLAIDYDQSYVIWGRDRDYFDISDQIEVTSFYAIWSDGEDANGDGTVDELDEELYGTIKLDDDGNKIYDTAKIMLIEFILPVESEINFTLKIFDSDGASTDLSGTIRINAAA